MVENIGDLSLSRGRHEEAADGKEFPFFVGHSERRFKLSNGILLVRFCLCLPTPISIIPASLVSKAHSQALARIVWLSGEAHCKAL
jgi:hypothetical protein